jgi:hypothetical protein
MSELIANNESNGPELRVIPDPKYEQLKRARESKTRLDTRLSGRLHEDKQLIWLYQFGLSSEKVLRHVTADKSGRVLRRLKQKGLVEVYLPPLGHVTQLFGADFNLVVLTKLGLSIARGLSGELLNYPEIHRSKINYRQAGHVLEIQLAIHQIISNPFFSEFLTERQQAQKSEKNVKRFDAIIRSEDGRDFGLEVETTRKTGRELDEAQARIYAALQERKPNNAYKYERIFYLVHPDIFKKYQKKFVTGALVYSYIKNKSGAYVRANSVAVFTHDDAKRIMFDKLMGSGDE